MATASDQKTGTRATTDRVHNQSSGDRAGDLCGSAGSPSDLQRPD